MSSNSPEQHKEMLTNIKIKAKKKNPQHINMLKTAEHLCSISVFAEK